jgi:hypothetical protein
MRDLEHSQSPGHPFRNFIRSRHVTSTATVLGREKSFVEGPALSLEDCRRGANAVHLKRKTRGGPLLQIS